MNFQPRIIRDQNDEECYILSLSDFVKKLGFQIKLLELTKRNLIKILIFIKKRVKKDSSKNQSKRFDYQKCLYRRLKALKNII